jgi:hypothetical protein
MAKQIILPLFAISYYLYMTLTFKKFAKSGFKSCFVTLTTPGLRKSPSRGVNLKWDLKKHQDIFISNTKHFI